MGNFVSCVLKGIAKIEDINNWIEFWFEYQPDIELKEALGFTDEEFALWCKEGDHVLHQIIENHRKNFNSEETNN